MCAIKIKRCKDCGKEYPETREYFGQYNNVRDGISRIGYRNSCRKCMAERTAKHSKNNPHQVRARWESRKRLQDNALGFYMTSDLTKLRRELNDKCRFCGAPLNGAGEVDHLTPLARGGTKYARNLTLACLKCNREKTNKTLDEYRKWRTERGLKNRKISPASENPDAPRY
jgi:5-methylcytosine-specific restriction endonuclease McrA